MIAALLLAAALPANFPKGTPVSIEQVRSDPRRWHGQWVQVEGWVQRCTTLDCALYERPLGQGMHLGFSSAESFDRWIRPFLPAKVIVVARINSECLLNLCTDRAPVLIEPFVELDRWNVADPLKDP